MSKVLVLQPTRGLIFAESEDSVLRELALNQQYPQILRTYNVPLPDSRNQLIDSALDLDWWKYLWFVDDDIIVPDGFLEQAIKELERDSDVVVLDYPHHTNNKKGTVTFETFKGDEKYNELSGSRVAWAGMGCVLAKRKVIEKIEKPLFKNTAYAFQRDENGKIAFRMNGNIPVQALDRSAGEDVYFFMRLHELKFKIKLLPMIAGHARVEKFCLRFQQGRYKTSHDIKVNAEIEEPDL